MALLMISTEDDNSNLEEPSVKKQKGKPAFSTKVEYEANISNTIALTPKAKATGAASSRKSSRSPTKSTQTVESFANQSQVMEKKWEESRKRMVVKIPDNLPPNPMVLSPKKKRIYHKCKEVSPIP